MSQARSQLSPHHAVTTKLPGPLAALNAAVENARAIALLVPGYTGSKEDFVPLLDGCAAAGYDTFAIDLPGQNDSPGPSNEAAYLPHALGKEIAGLIDYLAAGGTKVLLLGHSYGGLVARAAVLAGAPVAGLTLLDSGPAKLPDGPRHDALELGEALLRQSGTEAAYQVRESFSARQPGWSQVPTALKDFLRARFVKTSPAGLLGMTEGLRSEPDRVEELAGDLAARSIPCLVVAGEYDDAWSVPEQRSMANRLHAEFALVPGAMHSPNTENPDGLLAAVLPVWQRWTAPVGAGGNTGGG